MATPTDAGQPAGRPAPPPLGVVAARRLDMNEGALKVAIHRFRKRFRKLVKAEITPTVGADVDVQVELNYLLEVLSQPV